MGAYENTHGLNLCTLLSSIIIYPKYDTILIFVKTPFAVLSNNSYNYHEIPEQQMDKPRTDLLNV